MEIRANSLGNLDSEVPTVAKILTKTSGGAHLFPKTLQSRDVKFVKLQNVLQSAHIKYNKEN